MPIEAKRRTRSGGGGGGKFDIGMLLQLLMPDQGVDVSVADDAAIDASTDPVADTTIASQAKPVAKSKNSGFREILHGGDSARTARNYNADIAKFDYENKVRQGNAMEMLGATSKQNILEREAINKLDLKKLREGNVIEMEKVRAMSREKLFPGIDPSKYTPFHEQQIEKHAIATAANAIQTQNTQNAVGRTTEVSAKAEYLGAARAAKAKQSSATAKSEQEATEFGQLNKAMIDDPSIVRGKAYGGAVTHAGDSIVNLDSGLGYKAGRTEEQMRPSTLPGMEGQLVPTKVTVPAKQISIGSSKLMQEDIRKALEEEVANQTAQRSAVTAKEQDPLAAILQLIKTRNSLKQRKGY